MWYLDGVVTKAEEDGVDGHGVDAEEDAGDEESTQHDGYHRHQVVIQLRQVAVQLFNATGEHVERGHAHHADDDQPPDE